MGNGTDPAPGTRSNRGRDPCDVHVRMSTGCSRRWAIMGIAFLGVFGAIGFARFGYSAILPSMQEALDLSGAAAGSLASWNLGAYMTMALVGGLVAARFGPRIVITTGIALTAIGMLLTGLSADLVSASAARILTGLGNGMVLAPSLALLASWFQARQLGLASAVVSSGAALALVTSGPTVPLIIAWGGSDGWRWAWYAFAAAAALMGILAGVFLRDRPRSAAEDRSQARASVFRGFGGIVRSRFAWHLGAVYFLYGFGFITFVTFFQRRLVGDLGFSGATAGYLFLAMGAAALAFGLTYGVISDRIGRGRALAATLTLEAAAAVVLGLRPGIVPVAVAAILFGSGGFSLPGLVGAACGERFGHRMAAASLGFLTIFIGVGQALGPYLSGLLADAFSSYGPPYLLSAAVLFVSAIIAALLDAPRFRAVRVT